MLSLAEVASAICCLFGEFPPRRLPQLPSAPEAFEAIVVEVPLRAGPLRLDVMGAIRNVDNFAEPAPRGVSLPWGIPLLWFEWDLPAPDKVIGPLRFYCMSDAILGKHAEQRPPREPGPWRSWVREVLAAISPDASRAWCISLERVLSSLPLDAIFVHVASLVPRGAPRIRLVFALRAGRVASWLVQCQWPGDTAEISGILDRAVSPSAWVGIQLELSPELESTIGIELPEIRDVDVARAAGRRYFEQAAGLGCHPAESGEAALSRWIGGEPPLERDAVRFGYLKLCRDERGWTSKLYLGAQTSQVTREMSAAARAYESRKIATFWQASRSGAEGQEG